jgi:hypothetical protein
MPKRARFILALFLIVIIIVLAAAIHLITRDPFGNVVDHYHALNEPITPADFESPAPPDDQNASIAALRAASEFQLSEDDDRWFGGLVHNKPETTQDFTRAEQIIATHADALAHARSAVYLPQMRFPGPVIDSFANTRPASGLSKFNQLRYLANMLRIAAIVHHHQHNDPAALRDIDDILRIATIAGHDGPLIAHLVEIGITALATDTLQIISPDLRIDPSTRPLAESLITALLDDAARQASLTRTWQVERAWSLESLRIQFRSPISWVAMGQAPASIARADDRACAAELQPNWPTAKACLARTTPPAPSRFSIGQNLAAVLNPSLERAIQTDFRILMDRRLSATMLAIRLYQSDHNGQFPPLLSDLSPKYLPALPADPLAADGSPLRYRRDPSPILYSVGQNAKDDGGNAARTDPENEWSSPDYVIPLSPSDHSPAPQTAPSSRPG